MNLTAATQKYTCVIYLLYSDKGKSKKQKSGLFCFLTHIKAIFHANKAKSA